jgi:hypothetical protein
MAPEPALSLFLVTLIVPGEKFIISGASHPFSPMNCARTERYMQKVHKKIYNIHPRELGYAESLLPLFSEPIFLCVLSSFLKLLENIVFLQAS